MIWLILYIADVFVVTSIPGAAMSILYLAFIHDHIIVGCRVIYPMWYSRSNPG